MKQAEDAVVDVLVDDSSQRSSPSKEEERRLVRKLDLRVMPILCIMYLFASLDRTNLGNARLQGLPADVLGGDPTGVLFDWANSAFYFPFIICQIPGLVISKLYSPRIWIGCVAIGWGISSTLMASVFNFPGLLVSRLALGLFESGYSPMLPLYLSFFYTREEFGVRTSWWYMFSAVAGAFGGLIAFGVQHIHAAIAQWRLLFIIEGIPTILLGILALYVLHDRPEETPLLTEREREIALERGNRGGRADVGRVIQRKHIPMALKDWKLYAAGAMLFSGNTGLTSLQAFLPTIIASFDFGSDAVDQVLTVPPYAVAVLVLCVFGYCSDRLQRRGPFISCASIIGGIGYILLLTVHSNNHVRYFATFCTATGIFSTIAFIIGWFNHNLGSETKRATGLPLYMAIGHCGSIMGSHLFPSSEGPLYLKGNAVCCGLMFFCSIVAISISVSTYYIRENRRRDEKYGKPTPGAPVDVSELADEAPNFRYTP
ncbi:MFS general substrate transporter [Dichomitus squalens]|uniref:MFS general substrate transporter n=1 Tax=Dichomitus squalens TaxID=114155 RepID=A0A4Q9PZZ2_9APHY|nr:MFS general substrate transporter [Dichomitus squalens]TBU60403.1 MFS general substrate transporter [Dichomitus squalens]